MVPLPKIVKEPVKLLNSTPKNQTPFTPPTSPLTQEVSRILHINLLRHQFGLDTPEDTRRGLSSLSQGREVLEPLGRESGTPSLMPRSCKFTRRFDLGIFGVSSPT